MASVARYMLIQALLKLAQLQVAQKRNAELQSQLQATTHRAQKQEEHWASQLSAAHAIAAECEAKLRAACSREEALSTVMLQGAGAGLDSPLPGTRPTPAGIAGGAGQERSGDIIVWQSLF